MSQPNGGDPQSGTTGAQSGAGSTDPANPTTATPPVTDPAQSGGTQTPETVSKADFDALAARMAAADRRAAAAEKKIKDADDAALSEADKVKQQNAELQAEIAKERERNQQQALENAVLLDQTYSWYNNANVLRLIDRDLITFDDKGQPQGVKAALDKLAKSDAHLLKPKEGTSGDDGKDGKPGGTTGVPSGGRGTTGAPSDAERWRKKFPAMRDRV